MEMNDTLVSARVLDGRVGRGEVATISSLRCCLSGSQVCEALRAPFTFPKTVIEKKSNKQEKC